jgi:hypothetical protein
VHAQQFNTHLPELAFGGVVCALLLLAPLAFIVAVVVFVVAVGVVCALGCMPSGLVIDTTDVSVVRVDAGVGD